MTEGVKKITIDYIKMRKDIQFMRLGKRKLALLSVLTAVLILLGSPDVHALSSDEIKEQIEELEEQEAQLQEQMDALEQKLADNLEQMEQMVAQKDTIDQQIFLLNDHIANINEQITAYGLLVADQQDILDASEAHLEDLRQKYKDRIRAMEEEGALSYWSVIFKATSFSDLLDRLNMIREIAQADQRRLEELADAADAVAEAKDTLEAEKSALELTRQELRDSQAALEEKRAEADELLRELMEREAEFEALLEESERKQEQLMEELAQKEDEYDQAKYEEWLATYVPPQDPGVDIPVDSGQWITPVSSYRLSSPFGMRLHPILGIYRMHNGVDMACPEGTPIYASRGGQVSVAAYQANGAGNYVQINHGDGFRSMYMHMTHYVVSQGQYVAPGQLIGYVGNTGLSKGAHLHFGISYNGTYVNPMEYIG